MNLPKNKTAIMGILNITPDSFSDGGIYYQHPELALDHAEQMISEGANIIDIGGQSSRPGADVISVEEELARVLPIVTALQGQICVPISVDTYKPEVAEVVLAHGVQCINDITGLTNPKMQSVLASYPAADVVIMHMQGDPKTMQEKPIYRDVVQEIKDFFSQQIAIALSVGITHIILDPGIGFGKTLEHNLEILQRLHEFTDLGYPILVGASRKSFIGTITRLPVTQRLEGTLAANIVASMHGANIVRVHDVRQTARALQISDAITRYSHI